MDRESILGAYKGAASKETEKSPYTWLNYQPINLPGYEETLELRGRDCFDRALGILSSLDTIPNKEATLPYEGGSVSTSRPLKIVDWGCNLGFFCFEAAKKGYSVTGIDTNAKYVDICNALADTNFFKHKPVFHTGTLNEDAAKAYPADIAFCFSVLHHIFSKGRGDGWRLLQKFAETYSQAYIEMDGPEFGRSDLSLFYFFVKEVAESNDRYGASTKRRKTLYCSNLGPEDGSKYESIKINNRIFHRGVFSKTSPNGEVTVIKRERVGKFKEGLSHTWIRTNLEHEKEIYEKYKSDIFPKVLSWNRDEEYSQLEMEYFKRDGEITAEGLDSVFNFLKENNLFIIDLVRDMLIPTVNGLKLIDVESVFEIDEDIPTTISKNTKVTKRVPYDTYEKQISVLKKIYNLT